MRILIIHHLEKTWESGYTHFGKNFYDLADEVIKHIRRAKYDHVILTQFENWNPQDEHYESGLVDFVDEWHDYGYGWEECHKEDNPDDFVKGGNHSVYVYITDWMRNLKNHKVSICGAFRGECMEDLEIALKAVDVKFRRINKLIIG